jgi:hypothetical protein
MRRDSDGNRVWSQYEFKPGTWSAGGRWGIGIDNESAVGVAAATVGESVKTSLLYDNQ